MKNAIKFISSVSLLAMISAQAMAGETLEIRNFIGTIDVVTGDYDKITVTDADGAHVSTSTGHTLVDDGRKINSANCRSTKSSVKIGIGKWSWNKRTGYKDLDEYPKLLIKAPDFTHVIIKDSILFGNIDDVASGDIEVRSCGDLEFESFSNNLKLRISGAGDVSMKNAKDAEIQISGSGDLEAENFNNVTLDVSGSGDAELGDIAGNAHVESSGAGDIELGEIAGDFEYEGSGSTDLEVGSVDGNTLSLEVSGSGDATIHDGDVKRLYIHSSGASDITYNGNSVDAEVRASGASDIYIRRPSGQLESHDSGAADVNIRN